MLIERGVPVALATDVNPGGGFSPSMPFAMTLACFGMGLTLRGSARRRDDQRRLRRSIAHDRVGSLEPGKQMDAVIVDGAGDRPDSRRRADHPRGDQARDASSHAYVDRRHVLDDESARDAARRVRVADPTPGGGSASALAGASARRC